MLNKTPMIIRVGTGAKAILEATGLGWQAEVAMCTDAGNEGRVLICPATEDGFVSPITGSNPPTITGSRSTDTADILAQLLTMLEDALIIVDDTTS